MTASLATGTTVPAVRAHRLLPDTDGLPVPHSRECYQSPLLTESLKPVLDALHPEGDYFIGQDVGIYWRRTDPPLRGCKSPDWYAVEGVPRLLDGEMRRSYVLWEELVSPLLVIEYVSAGDGSEERDQTPEEGKFWVYERRIQASYYAIYEPDKASVEVYQRVGSRFRKMTANEHGRYPIAELGIELGIWQGSYRGYEMPWLRAWDSNGQLLPADTERTEAAQDEATTAKEQAEAALKEAAAAEERAAAAEAEAAAAKERAERLAAKLRELGVGPQAL
jgi:Uma2 family endonuclease